MHITSTVALFSDNQLWKIQVYIYIYTYTDVYSIDIYHLYI